MIIGFGSTEQKVEENLEREFLEYATQSYRACGDAYFTDEFRSEVAVWAEAQSRKSRETADSYKDAEKFPDRYSYYWLRVVGDASSIVFIVKFSHINRRHALSPDGWAMMQSEKLIHLNGLDIRMKEAA
jgi:hypothetical protein